MNFTSIFKKRKFNSAKLHNLIIVHAKDMNRHFPRVYTDGK